MVAGQSDALTVTVSTGLGGSEFVPLTGTVSLFSSFDGGPATLLLQIPVGVSGSFPGLTTPGTYDLYVSYSGDSNYSGSTSNSVTITVTGTSSTGSS